MTKNEKSRYKKLRRKYKAGCMTLEEYLEYLNLWFEMSHKKTMVVIAISLINLIATGCYWIIRLLLDI